MVHMLSSSGGADLSLLSLVLSPSQSLPNSPNLSQSLPNSLSLSLSLSPSDYIYIYIYIYIYLLLNISLLPLSL